MFNHNRFSVNGVSEDLAHLRLRSFLHEIFQATSIQPFFSIFAAAAAAAGATAVRRTAGRLSAVRGARCSSGGCKN